MLVHRKLLSFQRVVMIAVLVTSSEVEVVDVVWWTNSDKWKVTYEFIRDPTFALDRPLRLKYCLTEVVVHLLTKCRYNNIISSLANIGITCGGA